MGTIQTRLQVINNTDLDITNTKVYGCDDYDWDANSPNARPDRNFQGQTIPAGGGSVNRRAELNKQASDCPFNMVLHFSDGSVDEFRIHQRYAIGCCPGFSHRRGSHDIHYSRSGNTLIIRVENGARQQHQDDRAEEKNREGVAAMGQQHYETAIKRFDEALSLADRPSTVSSIKSNKSEACSRLGRVVLQEAWDLEADDSRDNSKGAQRKFVEAQDLFRQARDLQGSAQHQTSLNLVTLKIDGNRLLNEADQLEKQGLESGKSGSLDDRVRAQNAYKAALAMYQQAAKKFEAAARIDRGRFEDSVQIVRGCMRRVEKVIDGIDKAPLNEGLGPVKVEGQKDKRKKEQPEANVNLHGPADVEAHRVL